MINHKITSWIFALTVGVLLAVMAYRSGPDAESSQKRAMEEAAVMAAREDLQELVDPSGQLQLVDPLAPDRVVGKSYIYPADEGWQVSGYYRRGTGGSWNPFILTLDSELELVSLSVQDRDPALAGRADQDPRLTVVN